MIDQIDRDSSIPLYEQIKQIIRFQILSGEYTFGSRLPTEEEYCQAFSVSAITVKRALNELASAGLVSRRQGSGTIVTRQPVDDNFKLTAGFSEIARLSGRKPYSRILKIHTVPATPNLLKTFQLPANSEIRFMSFQRLMMTNDRPSAVLTAYVLEEIGETMRRYNLNGRSFYRLYEEILGRKVIRNENTLTPVNVSPDVARLLEVDPGSAHMHIRGVSYIEGGLTIEMSVSIFSGDYFEWKADTYQVREPAAERLLEPVYGEALD
ncbi:MAG TPA: GntR family transcriptional regulator [Anaerolineales bacterium]|nr:GntR family transcriptional regulator [Anaerolineales bacterium]